MFNISSVCSLGLVALIAVGGCGSGSGRPTVPPPEASSTSDPSIIEPGAGRPAPVVEVKERPRPVPGLRRSFDAPLRAPAVATGDSELDPLVAYLKASFASEIRGGRRLVITLSTGARLLGLKQNYQDLVDELMSEASNQVPAEMIRDFCEKNRGSSVVWPELTRYLPAILLTPEEEKSIFLGSPSDGWKRFNAKYPDAYGKITVSRVGLNRDKTLALFYLSVSHGSLNGNGQYHILRKEGDVWVELPINIGSTWTARKDKGVGYEWR